MTSRQEDETICIGGIIGLDVSRMLKFSVDKRKGAEQTEQVCADRMQEFYLALKEMGSDVLFWNVPRLQDAGFSWAPRSFTNLGSEQAYGRAATITRSGLFTQLGGISLGSLSLADLLAKPVVYADTDLRQIFFRPDMTFYKQPLDFDPTPSREFELVAASSPTRKAFIAEVGKKRGPLKLVRYIIYTELIGG
ncbi:hypothetical protein F5Y00DRAFT_149433 [Daldinia vernicosa]|uniref:uncharacterized protein n=1 Tax=Daldinia vernicosa TaxID=114800 RepID=UPI0020086A14|nr:uncharacterized protein F5Y00DRAFT_149433 [Daldinia vernicosa]KAI0846123.1 hypothetical protein F5Y00DRAFT_149433 [Daldinia vernicosa]